MFFIYGVEDRDMGAVLYLCIFCIFRLIIILFARFVKILLNDTRNTAMMLRFRGINELVKCFCFYLPTPIMLNITIFE